MIDPKSWAGPIRSEFRSDADMRELIRVFVDEMPERIASLEAAWEAQCVEDVRGIARQLRGDAGGHGFAIVGDAAAELEFMLQRASEDLGAVRSQFDALVNLCSRASC